MFLVVSCCGSLRRDDGNDVGHSNSTGCEKCAALAADSPGSTPSLPTLEHKTKLTTARPPCVAVPRTHVEHRNSGLSTPHATGKHQ